MPSPDGIYNIAVDFDNTLTNHSEFPITGSINASAARICRNLASKGYRLILWTARQNEALREALSVLKQADLYDIFDWNYLNESDKHGDSGKLLADFYIDDRSMFLYEGEQPDWNFIYNYILERFPINNQ